MLSSDFAKTTILQQFYKAPLNREYSCIFLKLKIILTKTKNKFIINIKDNFQILFFKFFVSVFK